MQQTTRLLQNKILVTLFTRANCSLCDNAKSVIKNLTKKKNFDYRQVDVMASGQKRWKILYEFDVPVLHVQSFSQSYSEPMDTRKLMHRFDERQVEELIEEAEKYP